MPDYPTISSAQNSFIKAALKLRDRRGREKAQLTLLEGYRELSRAREYGMEMADCFFAPELFLGENEHSLLEALASDGVRVVQIPPHLLEKMAYRDRPEGLIATARIKRHRLDAVPLRPNGLYLIVEAVEKPGNLGSILRSADAAGADALIICNKTTDLYNPNVIRASTGALFSVPLAETDNESAIAFLRRHRIRILAATPHADRIFTEADLTGPTAIVVGTEQHGLSSFWLREADLPVRIPMLGRIDSLNVATAATLLVYEAARQRGWRTARNETATPHKD